MAAALLVAVTFVYPPLNPSKSGRELAVVMRDATAASRAAGRPVLGLDLEDIPGVDLGNVPKSVNFYSDGIYLKEVSSPEELAAELSAGGPVYLLATRPGVALLPEEIQERMSVLYSTRLSRRDLVFLRLDG